MDTTEKRTEFYEKDAATIDLKFPYKFDMPRYQFATQHILASLLYRNQNRDPEPVKVLDIGIQDGPFAISWAMMGASVVGVDISETCLGLAHAAHQKYCNFGPRDLTLTQCDVQDGLNETIKEHGPYDFISVLEILEHLPDYESVLESFNTVSKQDTLLLVSVPANDSWGTDEGHLHSFWNHIPEEKDENKQAHMWPQAFEVHDWKCYGHQRQTWDEENSWWAGAFGK